MDPRIIAAKYVRSGWFLLDVLAGYQATPLPPQYGYSLCCLGLQPLLLRIAASAS